MSISQLIVDKLLGYKCKRNFKSIGLYMTSLYGENKTLTIDSSSLSTAVRAHNGVFVGKKQERILSFKGIPYALPPVGKLRWHAPQEAPASDTVHEAYYFGKSSIQSKSPKLRASFYPQGEDCLTLNIWTADDPKLESLRRPVMVYIHGGNYCWGGTSDPLFDGHNFVKAHPDMVLVTINYRLAIMGFLDLTNFRGGEDYKESCNLGILDQVESLRWIHRNINNFGGDATNVTVFGESAGGGSVSLLPLIDDARGLFHRIIVESGSPSFTCTKEDAKYLTDRIKLLTGIDSVEGLMKLSEKQLMQLNNKVSVHNRFPMRDGVIIPLDPYDSYRTGAAKDIDMLIGTNKDEARYWIYNFGSLTVFKIALNVWYEKHFKYEMPELKDIKRIGRNGHFDSTCQETVPWAVRCFIESNSFEDALRNAILTRGDTDTKAAITCSIAGAFYQIPDEFISKAISYLPPDMIKILEQFCDTVKETL